MIAPPSPGCAVTQPLSQPMAQTSRCSWCPCAACRLPWPPDPRPVPRPAPVYTAWLPRSCSSGDMAGATMQLGSGTGGVTV